MSQKNMSWSDRVLGWAKDRNLIDGSTPKRQYVKLMEEATELVDGLTAGNIDLIKDAIGDVAVVLRIISAQTGTVWDHQPEQDWSDVHLADVSLCLAKIGRAIEGRQSNQPVSFHKATESFVSLLSFIASSHGLSLLECQEQAWGEIKDRRGEMRNQVWVKEGD